MDHQIKRETVGMKIAFYGDSLTAGIPGTSYVDILRQRLPEHTLINYGKINDTPLSLHRRIIARRLLQPVDLAFVFVGVNDLLIERSWLFAHVRRYWAHDDDEFQEHYRALLSSIGACATYVVALSPLFIGEAFDNPWQQRLGQRAALIVQLAEKCPNAYYLDVRTRFAQALKNKVIVQAIHQNLFQSVGDALLLRTDRAITQMSSARGLHYTLDGIHLNVAGAQLVAESCQQIIDELYTRLLGGG